MGPPEAPEVCGACAFDEADRFGGACGADCLGDEMYTERTYIAPGSATGDHWITSAPYLERTYAAPGGPASELTTYYDGPDFVGLDQGHLERGRPTRRVQRVSDDEEIEIDRAALDAHGNTVVSLDPLGDPSDAQDHRRTYTYDDDGLQVLRTEIAVTSPEGEAYRLRREYAYEPALDRVIEATGWIVDGAGATSARNSTFYDYDEHSRLIAIARPGDTLEAPSLEVSYELGDPASRIVIARRSTAGETPDVVTARCLDGRGRLFQEVRQVREGDWLAIGFASINRQGVVVRVYQPYTSESGACATAPPEGVRYVAVTIDGLGRAIGERRPDEDVFGTASETRIEHLPLATRVFDEDDLDPTSPNAETPQLVRTDGLGRTIRVEQSLRTEDGIERAVTSLFYDGRGNVAGFVDAAGHEKRQAFDLAGRLVRLEDPNSGAVDIRYDAAGNPIARTDARGVTLRTEYDGANRVVARYDESDPERTRSTLRYDQSSDCPECTNAENRLVEVTYPLPDPIAHRLGGSLGVDRLAYDARGRLVRQERRLGARSFMLEDGLDGVDRAILTRFPDGQTFERRFDGIHRLVGIDGLVDQVEYDGRGQMARVIRADGSDETLEHDALMRLARMTDVAGGGEVLEDLSFTRDRRGQIVELADAAAPAGALDNGTRRFTYDSFHRLVREEAATGLPHEDVVDFEYDLIDNLVGATSNRGDASAGHVGALTYDPERPSIASQIGQLAQVHDEIGQLVERDGVALTWDFLGRLTEARRGDQVQGVFAYAADQQRVAKLENGALTLYIGRDFEVRDGVSRAYARIGPNRLARSPSTALSPTLYDDPDGDGTITAADALLEDDAAQREGLLHAAARRLLYDAAPGPVHLHHDHLGNLVAATRAGDVVGRVRLPRLR